MVKPALCGQGGAMDSRLETGVTIAAAAAIAALYLVLDPRVGAGELAGVFVIACAPGFILARGVSIVLGRA